MNVKEQNGIYQIEVPASYSYEYEGDALMIYNDVDGVGAISVTGYRIPEDYRFIARAELQDFVQSIDNSATLSDRDIIDCTTEYCNWEFIDNNSRYWRIWVLFSNSRAVFVSYNCDNQDKNVEKYIVDGIVKSVVHTT